MVIKLMVSQTRPHPFAASNQPFLLFITWLLRMCSMLRESALSGILQNASGLTNDLTDCLYSCWIQKQWGLHEVSDTGTVSEIHVNFDSKHWSTKQRAARNCSDWLRSRAAHCLVLRLNCEVRNSQKDSFQQCLTNLSVKDATIALRKYVIF